MEANSEKLLQQAITAHKAGKLKEAEHLYRSILKIHPNHPDANHNLGVLAVSISKIKEALPYFKKALKVNPNIEQLWISYIDALIRTNSVDELDEIIVSAKNNRSQFNSNKLASSLNNKGVQGKKSNGFNQTKTFYEIALKINPLYPIAYNNLGNLLKENYIFSRQGQHFKKAICLSPSFPEPYTNMADYVSNELGAASALKLISKSIKIKVLFPLAYIVRGNTLSSMKEFHKALISYKQAAVIEPVSTLAYHNLGNIYFDPCVDFSASIAAYNRALMIEPNRTQTDAQRLYISALVCNWAVDCLRYKEDLKKLEILGMGNKCVSPFTLLSLEDKPERHKKRSINYARLTLPPVEKPKRQPVNEDKEFITLGYFSSFMPEDPVFKLIETVISAHDRKKFKVVAFLLNQDTSPDHLCKLEKIFDSLEKVGKLSDFEVARRSKDLCVDVAIDLMGHTRGARTGIFSYIAAPVQINFLGYPGTLGSQAFQYIIADKYLIPEKYQTFYCEKVIYLPRSYQPPGGNFDINSQEVTRKSLNLPKDSIILCAFHNNHKITPIEFEIWCRILEKIKNSILWLFSTSSLACENLKRAALQNHVSSNRIIFCERTSYEEYLGRLKLADIFLDTFNYGAGATAGDALKVGLPIVTKTGKGYAARMAASLLWSLDLSFLIATTENEYEKKIYELAQNKEKLENLKKLIQRRASENTVEKYTKELELGYIMAVQRTKRPNNEEAIFV